MAGSVLRAAVVGASTLQGKELAEEIGGSAAAAWDLRLLDVSDEAEGQLTSAGDEALVIQTLSEASFAGVDVVFFAGGRETTANYVDFALQAGAAVVDLTGELAGREGFVVRSPWVDATVRPDLTTLGVVTPHAAALVLATVVSRLQRKFGVALVAATVLEPASEAGGAGVDELHQQTVRLLSFQELPKAVYGTQVAFNVNGALGEDATPSLAQTQRRMSDELALLLGVEVAGKVYVSLLQAPVFHGHVVSAFFQLRQPADGDAVRAALNGGVIAAEKDTEPSNQAAVESGDMLVKVEQGGGEGEMFRVLAAADNLRLAARNAVATALQLAALRPGARVQ